MEEQRVPRFLINLELLRPANGGTAMWSDRVYRRLGSSTTRCLLHRRRRKPKPCRRGRGARDEAGQGHGAFGRGWARDTDPLRIFALAAGAHPQQPPARAEDAGGPETQLARSRRSGWPVGSGAGRGAASARDQDELGSPLPRHEPLQDCVEGDERTEFLRCPIRLHSHQRPTRPRTVREPHV